MPDPKLNSRLYKVLHCELEGAFWAETIWEILY